MNSNFRKIYKILKTLSRDDLYHVLLKAGIQFPDTKMKDLTKEELLLVADEADMNILMKELK